MKGQTDMKLAGGAIAVITMMLLVILGGTILQTVRTDVQLVTAPTRITINESATFTYGTSVAVSTPPLVEVTSLVNDSAGMRETLGTGNYSVDSSRDRVNLTFATVVNRTLNLSNFPSAALVVNSTEAQIIQIIDAYNYTNGVRFTAGNFTVNGSGYNRINNATALVNLGHNNSLLLNMSWRCVRYNNSALNITYNSRILQADYNITTDGLTALTIWGDFFNVIVVTIVFVLIIGLFVFFSRRGGGQTGI